MTMNKAIYSTRQESILAFLAGSDEVSVPELTAHFNVAAMTIRRDLSHLAEQGLITRTHGGAILAAPSVVAFAFQQRRQTQMAQKLAIAGAAVRMVKPGMTVILDTGTTTLEVARLLGKIPRLKVLTSSLAVASVLLAHDDLELVLLGGTASKGSPDLSGPLTELNLAAFRADLAFISADALDERGFYTGIQEIANVSRAMIASARHTILVADSSKFGKNAFVRIAGWETIDHVIVDDGLPKQFLTWVGKSIINHTLVTFDIDEQS